MKIITSFSEKLSQIACIAERGVVRCFAIDLVLNFNYLAVWLSYCMIEHCILHFVIVTKKCIDLVLAKTIDKRFRLKVFLEP